MGLKHSGSIIRHCGYTKENDVVTIEIAITSNIYFFCQEIRLRHLSLKIIYKELCKILVLRNGEPELIRGITGNQCKEYYFCNKISYGKLVV